MGKQYTSKEWGNLLERYNSNALGLELQCNRGGGSHML